MSFNVQQVDDNRHFGTVRCFQCDFFPYSSYCKGTFPNTSNTGWHGASIILFMQIQFYSIFSQWISSWQFFNSINCGHQFWLNIRKNWPEKRVHRKPNSENMKTEVEMRNSETRSVSCVSQQSQYNNKRQTETNKNKLQSHSTQLSCRVFEYEKFLRGSKFHCCSVWLFGFGGAVLSVSYRSVNTMCSCVLLLPADLSIRILHE